MTQLEKMTASYYEVKVCCTSMPVGGKMHKWQSYDDKREVFGTLEQVKTYLKENYDGCKKVKIYQDGDDSEAVHTGYIYKLGIIKGSTQSDYNQKWYEQHWVTVRSVKATPVIV